MAAPAPLDSTRLSKAEAARRSGDPLALYDLATAAIADGDPHPRYRYLQALALARMGDPHRAEHLYDLYRLGERSDDEDALALRGRLLKDRALRAVGEDRRRGFHEASLAYLRAAAVRSGHFPLINAATTAWAAGEADRARDLARRVLERADPTVAADFFTAASHAEALILLGRVDRADQVLATALARAPVDHGDRAACYRQLEWICADAPAPAARRDALLSRLRPRPVVVFTGHMFRAGDPAESALAARIGAELDRLGATIAYGALACGADIVFAERILAMGGELHVVLPFEQEDFVKVSVLPGGEAWRERFDACLGKAASVTFATRAEYVGDDGQFAYGAVLAMGLAQLRASQIAARAVQIAVWDRQPARGGSGAAVDVAAWADLSLETLVIDPGPIDRALDPPPPRQPPIETPRASRAILFSRYRGYEQLSEAAIPAFIDTVMRSIAEVLDRYGEAVRGRNTWGDALYAVIADPVSAAGIAIEIAEALRGIRTGMADLDQGPGIALHYGPVYEETDHVTGRPGFYGSEVTLTARIEPKVIPGDIHTTQAFAAILAVRAPDRFVSRYLGQSALAKNYGAAPIYRLERRGDAGPPPITTP